MHFSSYFDVILKVFDLQRCTIYQKFAFFMGVLLVPFFCKVFTYGDLSAGITEILYWTHLTNLLTN